MGDKSLTTAVAKDTIYKEICLRLWHTTLHNNYNYY